MSDDIREEMYEAGRQFAKKMMATIPTLENKSVEADTNITLIGILTVFVLSQ
jgi:hypothetical protein